MADSPQQRDTNGFVPFAVFLGLLVAFVFAHTVLWPFLVSVWAEGKSREHVMLVSAVLAVLGTFFSAIVGIFIFTRQQVAREREQAHAAALERERTETRDLAYRKSVAAALRSEIRESLDRLADQFVETSILRTLKTSSAHIDAASTIRLTTMHGMPTGVPMEENIIFDSHKEKVFEFPEELVRALVRYYQNDRYLNRFLAAMSNGDFNAISKDRQKRLVAQYLDVGRTTLLAALRARTMLDAYLVHFCEERKDVSQEMTPSRAAACFDGFPSDAEIAEMLEEKDRDVFQQELDADEQVMSDRSRFDRYLHAAGVS